MDQDDRWIEFKLGFYLQAFTIDKSSAIKVKGITIKNAQQMNFVISQCDAVRVNAVQVSAPGDSPNTDGIHITASTNVVLQDCKIGTGSQTFFNIISHITFHNSKAGTGMVTRSNWLYEEKKEYHKIIFDWVRKKQ